MGFFSEEYEEQKNLQDNEDIQEIGEDSEQMTLFSLECGVL